MIVNKWLKAYLRTPFTWIVLVGLLVMVNTFAPAIADWIFREEDSLVTEWSRFHWSGVAIALWTIYIITGAWAWACVEKMQP